MINSLDLLVLVFVGMSLVSVLAICMMFLMKNRLVKRISLCFLAAQGMMLSLINSRIMSVSFPFELAAGWILGAAALASLPLEFLGKSSRTHLIARIMAAVSVIGALLNTFA